MTPTERATLYVFEKSATPEMKAMRDALVDFAGGPTKPVRRPQGESAAAKVRAYIDEHPGCTICAAAAGTGVTSANAISAARAAEARGDLVTDRSASPYRYSMVTK